jgi:two-component system NtrC family sensor kinase
MKTSNATAVWNGRCQPTQDACRQPSAVVQSSLQGNRLEASDPRQESSGRHAQKRHGVAEWLPVTLSRRLSLFVAAIAVGVVASVTYLEVRAYDRRIDEDLESSARLAGQSAAESLGDPAEPLDALDIRDALHDLIEADPIIDALSVIARDSDGELRVLSSTSTEERAEVLGLAAQAVATGAPATGRSATVLMYVVPVPRRERTVVAVTVGLESLLQARAHALRIAFAFAVPTILLVTVLVHLTVRHFVTIPLGALRRTIEATGPGKSQARAPVFREDEFAVIARGLNSMLDELDGFNRELEERVAEATRGLSLRNAQLAASHEALFSARESLARAERVAALGQVAANVAHQAGTPLNLVSGYVQMLRDDPAVDERVRSRLDTVDRQIQQVARVLRTMLDAARPPAGLALTTVRDVVDRVREVAEPRLTRSRIVLDTRLADPLPPIRADVTQLEMALLNLLTNAVDAMPEGGTVTIAADPLDNGGVRLQVEDTGTGIRADILDHLFELWVTSKPAGHGSGLGLAIVRDVARAHGGSVSAYNRTKGAVIVIDLPPAVAAAHRA